MARHDELTQARVTGNRDRYLARVLTDGRRAEDLQEFLNDWMEVEKQKALEELAASKTPQDIQASYQAAIRFYQYMNGIIVQAKGARRKGE
ncbi:hypothetical protein [Megasphaera massiliensis]|uniref:hypothetical protein n=2 Tax=Megasphaera massiliensis TaxID=1232428 RepID=UPI0005C8DA86|nr:hypothetical protein [Megasphaera massiliensis]MCQ5211171.1 hypothetical protein [Megasphaera massiliensis]DAF68450.1 MAG TPA: GAT domain protein [Caudoviricetes sp.]